MYCKTYTATLKGIEANMIGVEVDVHSGVPYFGIVGLVDKSISEAKERINVAMRASNYELAPQRIIVNLSPAHIRKEGVQLDLAIASALMINFEYIKVEAKFLENFCFLGELSLTGEIKPITGLLALALAACSSPIQYLIVPADNYDEASLVTLSTDKEIYQVRNLAEVKILIELLHQKPNLKNDQLELYKIKKINPQKFYKNKTNTTDLSDVVGQSFAKRGLEIAAAGKHHLLMIGPPGCGKSMLAARFPDLLPQLNIDKALELTKIYSICGLLKEPIMVNSPIRAPHHSASAISLVGGGANAKPGEVSLAHHGVLFLDELTEFNKHTIEQLRQILENKSITINRIQQSLTYPADFILIAACNPCPCGYLGDLEKSCTCTPHQINNYIAKLSGPLLDRIDIHLELNRLSPDEILMLSHKQNKISTEIRQRTTQTQEFIAENQDQFKLTINSQKLINDSISKLDLSARSYNKIQRLAQTIAALDKSTKIQEEHLLEALQFRSVDWTRYKKN